MADKGHKKLTGGAVAQIEGPIQKKDPHANAGAQKSESHPNVSHKSPVDGHHDKKQQGAKKKKRAMELPDAQQDLLIQAPITRKGGQAGKVASQAKIEEQAMSENAAGQVIKAAKQTQSDDVIEKQGVCEEAKKAPIYEGVDAHAHPKGTEAPQAAATCKCQHQAGEAHEKQQPMQPQQIIVKIEGFPPQVVNVPPGQGQTVVAAVPAPGAAQASAAAPVSIKASAPGAAQASAAAPVSIKGSAPGAAPVSVNAPAPGGATGAAPVSVMAQPNVGKSAAPASVALFNVPTQGQPQMSKSATNQPQKGPDYQYNPNSPAPPKEYSYAPPGGGAKNNASMYF